MDLPANPFKHAIKAGRQQIGLWSSLSSHLTVEILAGSGYDWLLLDTEHSPNELPMVHSQLQAATGGTAHPIVRPPWNDTVMVKRAMDAGAQSLLFPFVQNADEARRAVANTRYPPQGVRGVAGTHRGSRYGTVTNYLQRANEEVCVIVQIETPSAFDQLEAIAAVPGVDSIFIGPADLSASMGFLGDMGNAAVQEKLKAGAQLCKRIGKPCGIVGGNPEMAGRFVEYGFSWVAVGSDLAYVVTGGTEYLAKMRGAVPAAASKSQSAY